MRSRTCMVAAVLVLATGMAWAVPVDTFDGTFDEWSLTFAAPGSDGVLSFRSVGVQIDTDGDTFTEDYEALLADFTVDVSSAAMVAPGVWEFGFVNAFVDDGLQIFDGPFGPGFPVPPDGDVAAFDILLSKIVVVGQTSASVNVEIQIDILLDSNNSAIFDFTPLQGGGDFVMTINITGGGLPGLLDALLNPGPGNDIPPGNNGTSGSFSVTSVREVPEPTTLFLLGAGVAALAVRTRKQR